MKKRRQLSQRNALVTGASSGIGKAIALELIRSGANVLATARRQTELEQLTDAAKATTGTISILPGDITDPEHRIALHDWISANWGSLDVLVNNAGAGAIGDFTQANENRLRQIMEVNFFAVTELTRLCIPLLDVGRRPAILNVGSVLSYRGVPSKSEYCAAKFALRGWTEALRIELAHKGIDVLMISPSTTRSEFFDRLIETEEGATSASVGSMSPSQVAKIAVRSLTTSKRDRILSWGGRALVCVSKLSPAFMDWMLMRFATAKKAK